MSGNAAVLLEGIRVILRTFTVDETRYPAAEGRIKYNGRDFAALHYIEHHPGCKGISLARHLGVAPTTAQSVCERLIRQGLISRSDSPESDRAVAYGLTAEGDEVTRAIRRQDLANCTRMLQALPAAQRSQFAAQVAAIAEALDSEAD
ncbi:MAG: MarR family winged helix-turn-helix transcriptional regulator [Pseudomonadota bacterium]